MANSKLLILGIGVSVHKTDGVKRFEHFCQKHRLEYVIVGDGKLWQGGNMEAGPGGGQKINEIRSAMLDLKIHDKANSRLVVICDTFDLIPVAYESEIITKFANLCSEDKVLFSAEKFCWPDAGLSAAYPVAPTDYAYLNSGSIMGYSHVIYDMIQDTITDAEDDQRYFTIKFLSGENIVLDYHCDLFQAVNGAADDLVISGQRISNKKTLTQPVFIHGNGPSKLVLNEFENQIRLNASLELVPTETQSRVFIAAYINPKFDLNNFIQNIMKTLPSSANQQRPELFFYDQSDNQTNRNAVESYGFTYRVIDFKKFVWDDFMQTDCTHYLLWDNCVTLNSDTVELLLAEMNQLPYIRIISPFLTIEGETLKSNFWGGLDNGEYYRRSDTYVDLWNCVHRGIWNVPYVSKCILFERSIIANWDLNKSNKFDFDRELALGKNLRSSTLFMYMLNRDVHYGNLIN
jgi:hypothetical protein